MEEGLLAGVSAHDLAHAIHEHDYETVHFALVSSKPSPADVKELCRTPCGVEGSTLLHAAAEAGDTRILELVLKCGGQPHRQDHNGAIPLHYAAARGFADVCERLLKAAPATIEHVEKMGATPFLWAAAGGKHEAGKVLRKWGADVSVVNREQGWNALHYAVSVGSVQFVQLMLAATAVEVDAVDNEGRTPLHLACRGGWARIIELLVAAGADTTRRTGHGDSPAELCVSKAAFDALTLTQPGKAGIAPITPAAQAVAPAPPQQKPPPTSYPVREGGFAHATDRPIVPVPPPSRPGAVNNPVRSGRSFQVSAKS